MTEVLIDRDQPFRTFVRKLPEIEARTKAWLLRFHVGGRYDVEYRRSSGGHVHWLIHAPEMSEFDLLLLQAHLGSDWKRIILDMKRLAVGSHRINRAWDRRFVNGEMIRSGPWFPWFKLNPATTSLRNHGKGRAGAHSTSESTVPSTRSRMNGRDASPRSRS